MLKINWLIIIGKVKSYKKMVPFLGHPVGGVLDFGHTRPFRNHSASKATGVVIGANFSLFDHVNFK